MATRPAPAKKTPAKKAAAKTPAAAARKAKTAAPAPKSKAIAAPVVTLKAVFEQLGETHDLPKKQAHALLADFVAAVTTHLKDGARLRTAAGAGHPRGEKAWKPAWAATRHRGGHSDQGQQEGGVRPAKELKEAV